MTMTRSASLYIQSGGPAWTLASSVERGGAGLHGGRPVRARLGPAAPGTGITFVRTDLPGAPTLAANVDSVGSVDRCTRLGAADSGVSTVEHLLAALWAMGVDDARVEVDALELPALDGSALGWVEAIAASGRAPSRGAVRRTLVVTAPLGSGRARLEPLGGLVGASAAGASSAAGSPCLVVDARHEPGRGLASSDLVVTLDGDGDGDGDAGRDTFARAIAPARTFVFAGEVPLVRARGLGRGGSLENVLVLDDATGRPVPGQSARFPDEPVRHKILDALGDLALLGLRIHGRLVLRGAGHAAHVALARTIIAALPSP